jgi:hypothetical protein
MNIESMLHIHIQIIRNWNNKKLWEELSPILPALQVEYLIEQQEKNLVCMHNEVNSTITVKSIFIESELCM